MASRRLQSDRFLTVDFRPEIYSPFGMDWIANNGMTSVILRHCPDLAAVLPRVGERVRAVAAGRPRTGAEEHRADRTNMTGQRPGWARRARRPAERPLLTSIWRRRTHRVSRGSSHRRPAR